MPDAIAQHNRRMARSRAGCAYLIRQQGLQEDWSLDAAALAEAADRRMNTTVVIQTMRGRARYRPSGAEDEDA